jgi:transposase
MAKKGRRSTEEERIAAVRMLENGVHVDVVAQSLGVGRDSVYLWMRKYRQGGPEALKTVSSPGPVSRLSDKQVAQLYAWVAESTPQRFGFDSALWTRKIVAELILEEFKVAFTVAHVGRMLHAWGLSPQRPTYRAYQQDPEAVRVWMQQTYPQIRAVAEDAGATILFADEAGIRTDHHAGTTWAPVGCTPVVTSTGERKSVNMISAVSIEGDIYFDVFTGTMNAAGFKEFCQQLMRECPTPVFLILDGSSIHTANLVTDYVASTQGRLTLFFLPAYAPQLNPDEWVWRSVKTALKRVVPVGVSHLWDLAATGLRRLHETPDIIRGYFRDRHLAYITAIPSGTQYI